MCHETKANGPVIQTGENCTAHLGRMHRLVVPGTALIQNCHILLLVCACGMECSLVFKHLATVAQVALPFLAASSKAGPGRMTLMEFVNFCETYRNDIIEWKVEYYDPPEAWWPPPATPPPTTWSWANPGSSAPTHSSVMAEPLKPTK